MFHVKAISPQKHPIRYVVSFVVLSVLGIGDIDALTTNKGQNVHSSVCTHGVSHDLAEELSLHDDEEFLYH